MKITWLVTKLTAANPQPSTGVDIVVELRTESTPMDAGADLTITNTFDAADPAWTGAALAWITAKANDLGVLRKTMADARAATFDLQRAFVGKSGVVDV